MNGIKTKRGRETAPVAPVESATAPLSRGVRATAALAETARRIAAWYRGPNKRYKILITLAVIALAAAGGIAGYYRIQITKLQRELAAGISAASAQNELDTIIARVGQSLELPRDERPTLATVSDLEKLKDQPFFANAQIGDKVLIYTQAGKAILYRPATNKIIEVAPIGEPSPS